MLRRALSECFLGIAKKCPGECPESAQKIGSAPKNQGALKGTNQRGQTEPKRRFSLILAVKGVAGSDAIVAQ